MLSAKLNRWLLVGGAALGALAVGCAEEDTGAGTPPPVTGTDAGLDSGSQTGFDSGPASQCTTLGGTSGMACTLGDGGFGYIACVNGVPGSGPCMSIASALPEGGIGALIDGGLSFDASSLIPDGGFGDGGIGGACPSGFVCEDPGSILGSPVGIKFCGKPETVIVVMANVPPKCTATGPCTVEGITGTCQDIPLLGLRCAKPCQ